jgi:hypothetical protein
VSWLKTDAPKPGTHDRRDEKKGTLQMPLIFATVYHAGNRLQTDVQFTQFFI